MSAEENKVILRRLFDEFYNAGVVEVADQIFAGAVVIHDPATGDRSGIDGLKQRHHAQLTVTPDFHMTLEDMAAEGDKVAYRWTMTGTDQGGFMGRPPTNKLTTLTGITIVRFAGGKIVEGWHNYDMLGLLEQLGVIPMPGQGGS